VIRKLSVVVTIALSLLATSVIHAASYNDARCRKTAVTWTNDPCAGRQWGLKKVHAPAAWATTRGAGVTVAVVDSGADFNHPDLAANLLSVPGSDIRKNTAYVCPWMTPGPNATPSSAVAQDDNGHGTHVAGIIAAVAGNGIGVAGVAPAAKVLPVKALDADGSGSDSDVARAICFAADHGAKVINLSLGFDPAESIIIKGLGNETDQAVAYAFGKGAAVIIAAGNDSFPACDFPASLKKALCVGATDKSDIKAYYSNFGQNIGVVAPGGIGSVLCEAGGDVWSTIWLGSSLECTADGYETLAGTSMATPHVAAVAALIAARFGLGASPKFIYARLKATSDDLGAPGFDQVYGFGRVNALRAVS
jgi:serine protease